MTGQTPNQYRFVTNSDLDAIASAVLILEKYPIREIYFTAPDLIQADIEKILPGDILANLPYHPNAAFWFDHHVSNKPPPGVAFQGRWELAPSAARVIHNHFEGEGLERFEELLLETDRIDSGRILPEDVRDPRDYMLISCLIQNNGQLPEERAFNLLLIDLFRTQSIREIMARPEILARVDRFREEQSRYGALLKVMTVDRGDHVLTDLRGQPAPDFINRFMIYTLFPECKVSISVLADPKQEGRFRVKAGANVFKAFAGIHLGKVMEIYGGGGHDCAAGVSVDAERVEEVIRSLAEHAKETKVISRLPPGPAFLEDG